MSQKTTRKKRLKTSQNANTLQKKEESDIAKYFNECLTFVPDNAKNNENRLPNIQEVPEVESATSYNIKTRSAGSKSKIDSLNVIIPPKKLRTTIAKNNTSQTHINESKIKNKSYNTSSLLSVAKLQKSLTPVKNKSDVFNNITCSFSSSKILSLQALSDINSQKRLELANWGLPPLILEKYQARGINTMFLWQVECLANKKILEENKNLVYSAPTSAGKTLVAEFLVLKTVLERRKKAIFILPFVSVVREKMFYFQDLLSDSGVRVEGFMGGVAPAGGFSSVHIAIATIEKANSLINRLMETGDLVTLGAVVIDELHLLGDPSRGYLLELLLTKLRYMTLSVENIEIQLIGMSATLPNLPLIADWLDAELYKTDFRPIPLNEQCKIGTSIYDTKLNIIRELEVPPDIVNDTDNIIQLCIETISGGHGVLIFCPAKNWCETLATQLASTFYQLGRNNTPNGQILREHIKATAVEEILTQLQHSPVGLDNVLKRTVSFGVAFHHAGLTMDERDIIEGAFRVGSLKVLVATSTLSSGVNLPARRVIIRSPMFSGRPIDKLTYQQMIGRAGRMGKDTAGESILMCKPNEKSAAIKLMTASLDPIESCLENSGPLIRALLEAVASQIVRTPKDLDFYSKCTFVYKFEDSGIKEMVEEAVLFLISNEFLQVKEIEDKEKRIIATCLGKACLAASITPRDGLFLFEELQRARKCFVLDTELHVIYLVTPFNAGSQISQIDWMIYLELWRKLSESERRVGQLVGVEERFLMTAMRGIVKPGKPLNVHKRFYTAMALHDLVREVPLSTVCKKYNCCRGLLQSLQQSSSTFAGMVTNFCKELKWDCLELLFAQFQARLHFGVCRDLLDLLRLPSLNGLRARSLFKHGITTVAELAIANELDVEVALNKALPFESEKDFDGGNEEEIAKRNKMRTVFITGKDGLTAREAAAIVIQEARVLMKNELGCDIKWSQNNKENNQSNLSSHIYNQTTSRSPSIVNQITSRSPSIVNHTMSRSPSIVNHTMSRSPSIVNHTTSRLPNIVVSNVPSRNISVEIHQNKDDVKASNHTENQVISRSPSIVNNISSRNVSVEIHANVDDIKASTRIEESIANEKRSSTLNESLLVFTPNENNEPRTTPKQLDSLKMKLDEIESNNRFSENSAKFSTSPGDIINLSDKPQTSTRTLRSKLAERTKSFIKEDQFTIQSMDFQDSIICQPKPLLESKNLQNNENLPELTQNVLNKNENLQTDLKTLQGPNLVEQTSVSKIKEKTPETEQLLFENSDRISISSEDMINVSDKPQISTRSLRSKLAEKTKSFKEDPVTINTIDFQDGIDCPMKSLDKNKNSMQKVGESHKKETNIQVSSRVSDSCLNELMDVVEKENKDEFVKPAPVTDLKNKEEKKRESGGSNYSKSPSLFSDSSFLDAQVCSVLEKNVLDQTCLAEFEKSNFTPQNKNQAPEPSSTSKIIRDDNIVVHLNKIETPKGIPCDIKSNNVKKIPLQNTQIIENMDNDQKQMSVPMTWTEDSWDQTKNLQTNKVLNKITNENGELESPSLLMSSRVRSRLKPTTSIRMDTPKSILRMRTLSNDDDDRSPIAGIRTINARRHFLPSATSSNKSDSEDSIVNSQTINTRQVTINKTRSRIEKKLISTQKFSKSSKIKNTTAKIYPKLLKQNTEPIFRDSNLSDNDSTDSTESLMFESDDSVMSQTSKSSKTKKKTKKTPVIKNIKLVKTDSCSSIKSDGEKISLKAIEPVNVANSKRIFRLFRSEIEGSEQGKLYRNELAISLATESCIKEPTSTIGNRIIGTEEKKKKDKKTDAYIYGDKKILGIIFSWGASAVYFMPFSNSQETKITIKERMSFLKNILTNKSVSLRCFNAKEIYKMFYTCCEIESRCEFLDPKAGDWIINSETCNWSYSDLASRYFPRGLDIANNYDNNYGRHAMSGITRAGAKALLAWYITKAILTSIKEQSSILLSAYKEVEMPTILVLAKMELRGFGINMDSLQELSTVIKNDLSRVEEEAFGLAGRKFNFHSSKDVAQVLGLSKKGRGCTNKNALKSCENPISDLVMLWRKLNTVQTKIIFPLLHLEKKNNRIHGNCITYTVTGRVSMHEPNLQTIPRDFKSDISGCVLSARMAFVPFVGNVMLSADFCQLELRILAHFSQDPTLCKLMHEQGDIFKNIAARLNKISEDMVDDDMRQRAKQLCYAMIYGMGIKSLAETLSVTESEAKDYLEAFMGTYKGIRIWLNTVYDQARIEGFVTTLADRRRVLSGINSKISAAKAQAERQAVNTKVQGSAADITKKAMVMIESKLQAEFNHLPLTFPTMQNKRKLRSSDGDSRPRGAYLILQLHDELLYEVNSSDLERVARIVKDSMEHSFELRVPLPVKIKVGTAWGNLEEYKV